MVCHRLNLHPLDASGKQRFRRTDFQGCQVALHGHRHQRLIGRHDCQTGAPVSNFNSLVTFAQGGTLTNVTTGGNPGLRTTGLGIWKKAGDHEFTAVTMVFLFSPAGAWTATQRLANTFEIGNDPDELTGTTEANFYDTNGNLTATVCATVLGRRLD